MFKVRDKLAVEVHKAKERGNVTGHKTIWPVLIVEFPLGHCWTITIVTTINANKFKTPGEENVFLQGERQVMGQIDLKLAGHISHSYVKGRNPAKDVINNNGSASLRIKNNSAIVCKVLPSGVKVMDEHSENDRAVNRTKRHDSVGILGTIRARKSQLDLVRL